MKKKINAVKKTVELNSTLSATFIIERVGQNSPSIADTMLVRGYIILPSDSKNELVESLRFGDRVHVGGKKLDALWGVGRVYNLGGGVVTYQRYVCADFMDVKWSEAFKRAEAWVECELSRLIEALKVRAEALKNAED